MFLLGSRKTRDDRRDHLQTGIRSNIVRDAVAFSTPQQLLDDLVDRPDEDRGHLEDSLHGQAIPAARADELFGRLPAVVGNNDRADDAQLDVVESRARVAAAAVASAVSGASW